MNRLLKAGSVMTGVLVLAGITTLAFGQRSERQAPTSEGAGDRPAMRMMLPPPPPLLEVVGENLFVLRGQTLTKYKADTLTQQGAVKLAASATGQALTGPDGRHPMAGSLLLTTGSGKTAAVLVISGNTFYRLRASDLAIAAKATLPAPPAPPHGAGGPVDQQGRTGGRSEMGGMQGRSGGSGGDGGFGRPGGPGRPGQASAKLAGHTLYLQRGPQLLAIDATTGTVTGQDTFE